MDKDTAVTRKENMGFGGSVTFSSKESGGGGVKNRLKQIVKLNREGSGKRLPEERLGSFEINVRKRDNASFRPTSICEEGTVTGCRETCGCQWSKKPKEKRNRRPDAEWDLSLMTIDD